jgi:hypothetical protein
MVYCFFAWMIISISMTYNDNVQKELIKYIYFYFLKELTLMILIRV